MSLKNVVALLEVPPESPVTMGYRGKGETGAGKVGTQKKWLNRFGSNGGYGRFLAATVSTSVAEKKALGHPSIALGRISINMFAFWFTVLDAVRVCFHHIVSLCPPRQPCSQFLS